MIGEEWGNNSSRKAARDIAVLLAVPELVCWGDWAAYFFLHSISRKTHAVFVCLQASRCALVTSTLDCKAAMPFPAFTT